MSDIPENEKWPNYSIGSRDHLHAVGVLVAAWNAVETAYQALIQLIFPQHMKAGIRTFELLGNDGRVRLIRDVLMEQLAEAEAESLEHFLKAASMCKANRNVLAHAGYGNQPDGTHILLTKVSAKDHTANRLHTFSVEGLREMADATYYTANFGMNLWSAINLRMSNESWARQGVPPRFWLPLPEKPPLPRSWDQIREIPRPPQPPPGSSRE